MLNANATRNFCVKDFQHFRQANFADAKNWLFAGQFNAVNWKPPCGFLK